jgi:hypothetical protein
MTYMVGGWLGGWIDGYYLLIMDSTYVLHANNAQI